MPPGHWAADTRLSLTRVCLQCFGSPGCNFDMSVMPSWKAGTLMCLLRGVFSLFFKITKKAVSPGWHTEQAPAPCHSPFLLPKAGYEAHKRGIDMWQCSAGVFRQMISVKQRGAWRGWARWWDVPTTSGSPSQSSTHRAWPGCAGGDELSPVNTLTVQEQMPRLWKNFLKQAAEPSLLPHCLCSCLCF